MGIFDWGMSDEDKARLEVKKGLFRREVDLAKREFSMEAKEAEQETQSVLQREEKEQSRKGEAIRQHYRDEETKLREEHTARKNKGEVELAKLETKLETLAKHVAEVESIPKLKEEAAVARAESNAKNIVIEAKTAEITRLDELLKVVIAKLPAVELNKLNIAVEAHVATKKD